MSSLHTINIDPNTGEACPGLEEEKDYGLAIIDEDDDIEEVKRKLASIEEVMRHDETCGYKLLVRAPIFLKKSEEGGMERTHQITDALSRHSKIGKVIKIGKDAFAHSEQFPNGAYCKEGDWIVYGPYDSAPDTSYGPLCHIINDNRVFRVIHPDNYKIALKGAI